MRRLSWQRSLERIFITSLARAIALCAGWASTAQLTLNWIDSSTTESGFRVEYELGSTGSFAQLAKVPTDARLRG
jgi:hypothetical protein